MTLFRFFFCIAALLASAHASAACKFWHTISFADGGKACVTDYRLADAVSPGIRRSVLRSIPHVGGYVVAMPRVAAGRSCPAVVGMSVIDLSNTAVQSNQPSMATRLQEAVKRCEAAARSAGGGPECVCAPVLVDGATTLTSAQFLEATSAAPQR
ncbi:MAG: hypothetical protein HYX47_14840 [Burkholderiales bacterium]|nr:hypothetical protein [Burkholderiales bacterium]